MNRVELAVRLSGADEAGRRELLAEHRSLADVDLAYALKSRFDEIDVVSPPEAACAAEALLTLSQLTRDPEITALATWTAGLVRLQIDGQTEDALRQLNSAEGQFLAIGNSLMAARTQVYKLYALAMLGRYDEAVEVGLAARDIFLFHGDMVATGKIEQNLGIIYARRDRYPEAEKFFRGAREHFTTAGDQVETVKANNNLANVLTEQHQFHEAARLYEEALVNAEVSKDEITQAEIEANLGCLALDRGSFDRALDYLERSRRRYSTLGMRHRSAISEQELADAYLEFNLAPEADAIYSRVIPIFTELGMRVEEARALAYQARAKILLGNISHAHSLLGEARDLYAAEENPVGVAMVTLIDAQVSYAQGDYAVAAAAAEEAQGPLEVAGTWGRLLIARWLAGESARALGRLDEARTLLHSTLGISEEHGVPQVAQRCHTSLGMVAKAEGNIETARAAFERAIQLVEDMRAPLPAEEFRTAFVTDKLTPYAEMVRLCLADGGAEGVTEALRYIERARSRALLDMLGGALQSRFDAQDPFEHELVRKLQELREELNWFYSQINRPPDGDSSRSAPVMENLHTAMREREAGVLEIARQLRQHGESPLARVEPLDIARLQADLGADTALVEYFSLDGELIAFVVTDRGIELVRELGSETDAEAALRQLQFQMSTLRYGSRRLSRHMDALTLRTRHHLGVLYDLLLRPLEEQLGTRRLIVVPHRALHYVPFHALHDGEGYVIERREVSYAPSASVLHHCVTRPRHPLRRALLVGMPDAQTPRVRDEVMRLSALLPGAVTLLDEQTTLAALREHAPWADVVHLACHGQFRPDSPLFSSLRLGDGWLTVRDAYDLRLNCELVALSACETGLSAVSPGDELIGLARGFFSAGAPSLLVSLWTVDDESTATLMTEFYTHLSAGDTAATALRQAQCQLMQEYPHPFYWSPFVLLGRW